MRIAPILINFYQNRYNVQTSKPVKDTPPPTELHADTVSFSARIHEDFPKEFLKELMMYGLPCPVCNKLMLPLELLNEPASQALKLFDGNVQNMTQLNQKIFHKLSQQAPIYPDKNIQGLLQVLFSDAERGLIIEQREILDEINFLSRELPGKKGKELRRLIGKTFEKIFATSDSPKKRFKRKNALEDFDEFANSLSDEKLKRKIISKIRELPTSENSINAFIVKYASRSPEEIGMKLYRGEFGTMEHIIPDCEGGKIVIWECSEDNLARGNISICEQLARNPQMKINLQKHIDRLIEIHNVDFPQESQPLTKINLLKAYIFALKNEYDIASKGKIKLDISNLGEIPAFIVRKEIRRIEEMGQTNYLKNLYQMLQDK